MPPSRSDRSLLILVGSFAAIAVVLAGGLIYVLSKDGSTVKPGLIFVGIQKQVRESIRDEGPQYIPNTFGDDGFWLDLENGEVVALVLNRPGKPDCNVKWKEPKHGYVDVCNGDVLSSEQLDRYATARGPADAPKNAVFVTLKKTTAAPNPAPSR